MTEFDPLIDAALAAEERELLARIGEEPDYFRQLGGLFTGRSGWINTVMMASQALLFIAGVWSGWRFFQAPDVLTALHWGLPSAVLLIMSLMIKLAMWPTIQTNRVLLAMKRLELLIIRSKSA